MFDYDVVIIGAGIGGLTCGALLAKHGMSVLVCEQHDKPGGYCTSYKRGGYRFDVPSLIGGLRPGSPIARILAHLSLDRLVSFTEFERISRFVYPDRTVDFFTDLQKYEAGLVSAFPRETAGIRAYLDDSRLIWQEFLSSYYHPAPIRRLMYPAQFPRLSKYLGWTHQQLLDHYIQDENLKEIMGSCWGFLGADNSTVSALYMVIMQMSYCSGGAWYPEGGYGRLADAFSQVIGAHGGEVRLKAVVERIAVDGGAASGVDLRDGSRVKAKFVVSDADSRSTFLTLVGPGNLGRGFLKKVSSITPSTSSVVLHMAVSTSIPREVDGGFVMYNPHYGATTEAFAACRRSHLPSSSDNLPFGLWTSTSCDPELAQKGVRIVGVSVHPVPGASDPVWQGLDVGGYRTLKHRLADVLVRAAERLLPGLSAGILVMELSTPLTYRRYTGATEGCWYDAAVTPGQSCLNRLSQKTPIRNLYLTGAKTYPGPGLYGAIIAGLDTADSILQGQLTHGRGAPPPEWG